MTQSILQFLSRVTRSAGALSLAPRSLALFLAILIGVSGCDQNNDSIVSSTIPTTDEEWTEPILNLDSYTRLDAGVLTATIGDLVWLDVNRNGVQDSGEPGLEGVTIRLLSAGADRIFRTVDDYIATASTDGSGNYLFTGVPVATPARVWVDLRTLPDDKQPGSCPTRVRLNPEAGQVYLNADFCLVNSEDILMVIIDEDGLDNGISTVIEAAARLGVAPNYLVNDDRPVEMGNPPLRWSELFAGDIVKLPAGQVDDEGWFALPANTPFSFGDYVAGTVPQSSLAQVYDVMPLRNQDLVRLIGRKVVAVVHDNDISMNFLPIYANLQGERYGLFSFTVLAVEVPGSINESQSSTSLYDLWVRVEAPMVPNARFDATVRDHEPDAIAITEASFENGNLTIRGESDFAPAAWMTLSVDASDEGSDHRVPPFIFEATMVIGDDGQYEYILNNVGQDLSNRRVVISTDKGGSYRRSID